MGGGFDYFVRQEHELRNAELRMKEYRDKTIYKQYPQRFARNGEIITTSLPAEFIALDIIEYEEMIMNKYKYHYKNRSLLQKALATLNKDEVQAMVIGESHQLYHATKNKLSNYLSNFFVYGVHKMSGYHELIDLIREAAQGVKLTQQDRSRLTRLRMELEKYMQDTETEMNKLKDVANGIRKGVVYDE